MFLFSVKILVGSLFRRWWGGWLDEYFSGPAKTISKRILGYLLATLFAYSTTHNLGTSCLVGAVVGTSLISPFPPSHAYGTWMINGTDNQGRPHTILKDCLSLAFNYGVMTFIAGTILVTFAGCPLGFVYAPLGLFSPVPYLISKKIWEKFNLPRRTQGFISDHTSIGELALGALLLGGLGI